MGLHLLRVVRVPSPLPVRRRMQRWLRQVSRRSWPLPAREVSGRAHHDGAYRTGDRHPIMSGGTNSSSRTPASKPCPTTSRARRIRRRLIDLSKRGENNLPSRTRSSSLAWRYATLAYDGPWIPERSATRLREADLNVFSKLGNQGLEGRLEPEAFTGGEVRREDDLLDFLVGCPVDIQVARQPST